MEKQKNVMFGTSLNGYKKQDVNAFIASINAKFASAEEDYRREIAALRTELDSLRAAQAEADDAKTELAQLKTEYEALSEELARLNDQPQKCTEPEEIEVLRKKAALYDSMSSQLGDMMISANHNADLILDEARRDADQSLASVKSNIAHSAALLSGQLETLYRSANTRAIGEINAAMQQTQRALSKFLEELSARRTRLEEMLRQTDADTRRTADEQIAKMLDQAQDTIDAIGAKPAADGEQQA